MRVRDVELTTLAGSVLSRGSAAVAAPAGITAGVEYMVIGRALLAPVERSAK